MSKSQSADQPMVPEEETQNTDIHNTIKDKNNTYIFFFNSAGEYWLTLYFIKHLLMSHLQTEQTQIRQLL